MSRLIGWCLLVVWCAWLFAFQGLVASTPQIASWTPDIGIVLLLALDPRLERRDALLAVAIVAGARIGFSSDPPLAILAGYWTLVFVVRALRNVFEVDHASSRMVLAALGAALLTIYWAVSRDIALSLDPVLAADGAYGVEETLAWSRVVKGAVATALGTAVLGPLVLRLPGLTPLRTRSS